MDESTIVLVCTALFAVVCVQFVLQLRRFDYVTLITWPALIYFSGPVLTLMFVDSPVLGRYVWPEEIVASTLLMFVYVFGLGILGRQVNAGASIKKCIEGRAVRALSGSKLFLPLYLAASAAAASLQIVTLNNLGSVFSGAYVLEGVDLGLIPYWGFLAGLYEIVFLCFVIYLVGNRKDRSFGRVCILLYVLTAALRLAGGTRLLLVKELSFMLLLLYLGGSIKPRRLLAWGFLALCLGSAVGLLRTPDQENAILGPLFGLIMESGLNALTLNIAYHVQQSGFISEHADGFRTFSFFLINVLPTFVRFGIDDVALKSLSPYEAALDYGLDTSAPVGGMSGFATLCYLTSHPFVVVAALLIFICVAIRHAPRNSFYEMAIMIFVVNAIHFWRDPADIAFKLLVQGILICVALRLTRGKAMRATVARPAGPGRRQAPFQRRERTG